MFCVCSRSGVPVLVPMSPLVSRSILLADRFALSHFRVYRFLSPCGLKVSPSFLALYLMWHICRW